MSVDLKNVLLCGTSAFALAVLPIMGSASAQEEIEQIVVTGSRVITDGRSAPTPVTVMSAETLLQKAPQSVADALAQLPAFSGTETAGSTRGTGSGSLNSGTFLNLRGLGANRVLVLQDGHRLPPNRSTGLVNADMLPSMLIQRVDVVTGGASAAYGSDAVSGVVNYITDKEFTGVKGLVQGGIASRGDMENYRVGLAGGMPIGDRFHIIASADVSKNLGISQNQDRPNGNVWWGAGAAPGKDPLTVGLTADNPYIVYPDVHYYGISRSGFITGGGPLTNGNDLRTGADGLAHLTAINQGRRIAPGYCVDCPDNFYESYFDTTLVPKRSNATLFTRMQYEVNDNITAWGQVNWAEGTSNTKGISPWAFNSITIFNDNAYLGQDVRDAMAADGITSFRLGRSFNHPDNRILTTTKMKSQTEALGLEGKFGSSDQYNWDFTYSHGKASSYLESYVLSYERLHPAIDAARDSAGNIVCRVTITHPGLYPGCVPYNVFGTGAPIPNETAMGAESAAARAYIMDTTWSRDVIRTQSAQLNFGGQPFELWAGPVSIAIGGEYRKEKYNLTSNSGRASLMQVGVRGPSSVEFNFNSIEPSKGSRTVKEGYGEILVPLARDMTFAQELDVNGAVRLTDYSTSGMVTTWKVGGNWRPIDDIRFRGTLSRDIRAPSLFELFQGGSRLNNRLEVDPLTGARNFSADIVTGGNPSLVPEKSDTLTVGTVVTPRFVEGLTVSLDYYRFKFNNSIGTPYSRQQIVDVCHASGYTDASVCSLIERPFPITNTSFANTVTGVRTVPINIAKAVVDGLDLEVNYTQPMFAGNFNARLIGSYAIKNRNQASPTAPVIEYVGRALLASGAGGTGVAALPHYRGNLTLTYSQDAWSVSVNERYIGGMQRATDKIWADNKVSAQFYTDVNVTYDFEAGGAQMQTFLNVQNVFDNLAPLVQNADSSVGYPALTIHDVIGMYFTAGVRFRF